MATETASRKSKYMGIKWNSPMQIYECYISYGGTKEYLGSGKDERQLAIKYDIRAIQLGKKTNILKPKK